MRVIYPKFTNIIGIAQVDDGFVLENPFNLSTGMSNLYKHDVSLSLVWEAEIPRADDPYVGKFTLLSNGMIKIFSTDGVLCEIDPISGEIVRKHWSK